MAIAAELLRSFGLMADAENRRAYGSISDGGMVERLQFANARTNNEAEYMSLLALLGSLLSNRVDPRKPLTTIYMDSQLVVGQLTPGSKVTAKNLLPLHDEAASRLQTTGARLIWVPRNQIVNQLGH